MTELTEYEKAMQPEPMRYFSAQQCRRWPELFEPFDVIGGILWGTCATNEPQKLALIEALMAQPKLGVTEISEDDFTKMAQKKTSLSAGSNAWSPRPAPSQGSPVSLVGERRAPVVSQGGLPSPVPAARAPEALKGTGQAVVGQVTAPEPVLEVGQPVPSVAEALQLGEVDQAPTAKGRLSMRKK